MLYPIAAIKVIVLYAKICRRFMQKCIRFSNAAGRYYVYAPIYNLLARIHFSFSHTPLVPSWRSKRPRKFHYHLTSLSGENILSSDCPRCPSPPPDCAQRNEVDTRTERSLADKFLGVNQPQRARGDESGCHRRSQVDDEWVEGDARRLNK